MGERLRLCLYVIVGGYFHAIFSHFPFRPEDRAIYSPCINLSFLLSFAIMVQDFTYGKFWGLFGTFLFYLTKYTFRTTFSGCIEQ